MTRNSLAEMKALYPNEWILVGNPDLGAEDSVGRIIRRLVSGIILYHFKDKHEVAYKGRDARK